jgi:hypothetical protein
MFLKLFVFFPGVRDSLSAAGLNRELAAEAFLFNVASLTVFQGRLDSNGSM